MEDFKLCLYEENILITENNLGREIFGVFFRIISNIENKSDNKVKLPTLWENKYNN